MVVNLSSRMMVILYLTRLRYREDGEGWTVFNGGGGKTPEEPPGICP
jgi:hypothetical protein